jgi:IS4 transposase
MSQNSADDTRKECAVRWKIEEFHREAKQLTGIEKCQCRKNRIQRIHIACAMLVRVKLTKKTIYQVKHGLLDNYLIEQIKESCDSICVSPNK